MVECLNGGAKVCVIEAVEKVTFYKRGDWIYVGLDDRVWLAFSKDAFELVVRAFVSVGADLGIVDRFISMDAEMSFRCPAYGSA
ncbi:TPA_asm: hypothetical protein GahPV1_gp02 [Geoglobus ahangari pleomorphic virus 1]|uniref:Uncharacterized protein n=2 Tax=root TaxID=1 RepID=A0A0F7II28_9EURY|nr:hypothetical protein [Geoglobus ahangari]AKG92418.1 hypothetical protein GAH_00226 [Geoglobus ahangari]